MNEGHFKDLLFELIPPPAQRAVARTAGGGVGNPAADLMMMGFPTRLPNTSAPSLCVCHSQLKSEGFLCPRCLSKVCDVPTDCDICGLMIVSSPHLARSYHHLFPVKPYQPVYGPLPCPYPLKSDTNIISRSTFSDSPDADRTCHACATTFPEPSPSNLATTEGMSLWGRYRCPDCHHDFCTECDVFVHEVVHCCPGCGK